MVPLWDKDCEDRIRREAKNLDPQKLPDKIQFCTRCVVSSARPRITFDEEGVCSACRYAETKNDGTINWDARNEELQQLLARHRKTSGYDVIVPASGGKDSSMVAHRLKHEYGMHPLCVKMAPFIYTDIGRQNWEALNESGFDCIEMMPDQILHRKLARLSLEYLGDAFQPFVYGQLAFPMHIATMMNIRLVFGGENAELEYGGDTSTLGKTSWDVEDWDRIYLKDVGINKLISIGHKLGAITEEEHRSCSQFYQLPNLNLMERIEYHHFGYYRPWWPMDNYYYASKNCGFNANPDGRSEGTYSKLASLDDATDGFHYWFAYLKFGIGRCTSDAAQQVRAGDIERDEAVALVNKYDGEFPSNNFGLFKDYLGLDDEQFWKIVERFKNPKVGDA